MSIRELREAVEAGTATLAGFDAAFPPDGTPFKKSPSSTLSIDAGLADSGSLDAAKRLHDARVPDHRAILDFVLMEVTIFRPCHDDAGENTDEWDMVGDEVKAFDGNMARAWLIAVLKALEIQNEK